MLSHLAFLCYTLLSYLLFCDFLALCPRAGLSDLQRCEWFAASAQLLLRVAPLRNFFFNPANYELSPSALVQSWGEFTRKVCMPLKMHI